MHSSFKNCPEAEISRLHVTRMLAKTLQFCSCGKPSGLKDCFRLCLEDASKAYFPVNCG